MPAAVFAETSPDIGRLIQPEGYIVGFHQQTQVVIDLVGAHDAEFRGIVPLRQVDTAIGVDVIEVRGRAVQAAARMAGNVQFSLDVAGHPGGIGPVIEVDTDGVAAVLAFSVPDIGQTGMLIYAYITYILLSTAYTVVNIPMASILPALSEDPHERTVLASCRTFFSSIGSTVVSAFALTLVDKFGNGNEALGFRIVMMIFGVVGCLVFFFCFFNTKERVTIKQEKVSLKANISCLLHNKPWKLFALNIVWFFGGFVIQASAVIYYFTYVVQNTTLVQIVATITTLVPIVANLCAPFLVKLTSKRNLMVGGSFVHMGGLLIIFFGGTNVPVLLAGAVIAAAGYGLKGSMHFAMQPDPVDYGEWKSGVNTAGTLSAVNGFIGKVGMAIASSIGAALLQFGGFDANLATQTATAQTYITAMYIWVPIITNIATIITMMFYDLDKIYPQIVKELDERRANA